MNTPILDPEVHPGDVILGSDWLVYSGTCEDDCISRRTIDGDEFTWTVWTVQSVFVLTVDANPPREGWVGGTCVAGSYVGRFEALFDPIVPEGWG